MPFNAPPIPIKAKPCTAWIVETSDGGTFVQIWHEKATIDEVIAHVKNYHEFFTVRTIDTGELQVREVVQTYSHDARRRDGDGDISFP